MFQKSILVDDTRFPACHCETQAGRELVTSILRLCSGQAMSIPTLRVRDMLRA